MLPTKWAHFGVPQKRVQVTVPTLTGCHPDKQTYLGVILPRGEGSHHLDPDVGGEGLLPFVLAGKEGWRWL